MEKVSLVVPLKNEEKSIQALIDSICCQTRLPDEVIFVDGGSGDRTGDIVKENILKVPFDIKLIETQRAHPGEARNIGLKESRNDLVAFTDGGIRLDKKWLEEIVSPIKNDRAIEVVYGSYEPAIDSFIKECSLMAYVPPKEKIGKEIFRTNFIASSLFKKRICEEAGGFPPFRAAEDKIFMNKVKKLTRHISYTNKAIVYWQIPGSIKEIFNRFCEFSAHDILAGKARDWHFSIFRTYTILLLFLLGGIFIDMLFLWGILAIWIFRIVRIFLKKKEDFKFKYVLNIRYLSNIILIVVISDIALFCGSIRYLWLRYVEAK